MVDGENATQTTDQNTLRSNQTFHELRKIIRTILACKEILKGPEHFRDVNP